MLQRAHVGMGQLVLQSALLSMISSRTLCLWGVTNTIKLQSHVYVLQVFLDCPIMADDRQNLLEALQRILRRLKGCFTDFYRGHRCKQDNMAR